MPTGKTSFDKGHDHGFVVQLNGQGHTTTSAHGTMLSTAGGSPPMGVDSHSHPIINGEVQPRIGADGFPHIHEVPIVLTKNGYESAE